MKTKAVREAMGLEQPRPTAAAMRIVAGEPGVCVQEVVALARQYAAQQEQER